MSDYPKESRNAVRLAAAQLSAVVTIFLAGLATVSKGYLISGMALMGFAVLYLIFELVTSEPVAKNVPGMLRLLMAVFAAAIFLALNESTIKGFFGHTTPGIHGQVPCVHATIQTRVIARLHSEARIPPSSTEMVSLPFVYQELFYEVRANITSDTRATASTKADYLQRNDMYRIDPEGIVAERVPETFLDFKDPMGEADHYGLIVKADDLSETQPLVVTIRRSIAAPLGESDLIKLSYIRSASCEVERPPYDAKTDAERLNRQVKLFARRSWPPMQNPLPIHPETSVPIAYAHAAIEAWCKEETCKEFMIGNLIAKWNRVAAKTRNYSQTPPPPPQLSPTSELTPIMVPYFENLKELANQ